MFVCLRLEQVVNNEKFHTFIWFGSQLSGNVTQLEQLLLWGWLSQNEL